VAAVGRGAPSGITESASCCALHTQDGWWLLLDEVNLAPPEVLERLAGLLEAGPTATATGSGLTLLERGDTAEGVPRPSATLLAGNLAGVSAC
jgi:midasin (ATPase involved in ribosome maturation)